MTNRDKDQATTGSQIDGEPASAPEDGARDEIAMLLKSWERKLDDHLVKSEQGLAIGRELVEQRALNLDLQRQIHRLEQELRILRMAGPRGTDASEPAATMGTLVPRNGNGSPQRMHWAKALSRKLRGKPTRA